MKSLTNDKEKSSKKDLRPILRNMEIFVPEEYPLNRSRQLRTAAYEISIENGFVFKTKTFRSRGIITVTRIA